MGTWLNNDGLYIKYGTDEATAAIGGEYNLAGDPVHMVEFDLDLTLIGDSTDKYIVGDNVSIPTGAMVEKVEVVVREVTAGTDSNLNLGLIKLDRSTEIDFDGLLAAADAWHTAAIGTKTVYEVGTAEAGADIGQVHGADPGLIVAYYDTGAFTDGVLTIRIFWSMTDADML